MKHASPAKDRDVYIKFFPTDWRGDEQLQMCSLTARGLWIELMCIAHKHDGYVLAGGLVPTVYTLARQVRSSPAELKRLLAELTEHGVCSVDERGAYYSRRMVREAKRRRVNRENGSQGGNPVLLGISDNPSDNRTSNRDPANSDNRELGNSDKPQSHSQIHSHSQSPDREPDAAPTRELLTLFDELHQARFGSKAAIQGGRDAKRIADLWRQRHGDPVSVEALIRAFFQSKDKFIIEAGFTVGVFVSQIGKLITRVPRHVQPAEHWSDECARLHSGRCENPTFHAAMMAKVSA